MREDIVSDRATHYGTPDGNIVRIARLWSAYLGVTVRPSEVCWMMTMVKASRARVSPTLRDNYVDAHGYIDIAEALQEYE